MFGHVDELAPFGGDELARTHRAVQGPAGVAVVSTTPLLDTPGRAFGRAPRHRVALYDRLGVSRSGACSTGCASP